MLTVELDVFSGMPNPAWKLDEDEGWDFVKLLLKERTSISGLASAEDKLGYRGFIVSASGREAEFLQQAGIPPAFRVNHRLGDTSARDLPLLLSEESKALGRKSQNVLAEPGTTGQVMAARSACSLSYTSSNNFKFWNGWRKTRNNCYNYAANFAANNGPAMPGKKGGRPLGRGHDAAAMRRALKADGWRVHCEGSSLRIFAVGGYYVHFGRVYWDFHFYRKNLNRRGNPRWCHKRGATRAKNRDDSGKIIKNPRKCDRDFYSQELGTFFSPPGARRVRVTA